MLLDVPGVPRKSINVTLLPPSNLLRVRGQIKCGTDDACISRTVSHDLSLPRDADLSKNVQVGVRDGVLRVTVPRRIEESGMGWKALDVVEDTCV